MASAFYFVFVNLRIAMLVGMRKESSRFEQRFRRLVGASIG